MKKDEIIGNIIIVCSFSAMLVYSLGMHEMRRFGEVGGGFWPIVSLTLLVLFSAILLVKNIVAYRSQKQSISTAQDIPAEALNEKREGRKRYGLSVIILLIYIIVMPMIGFLLSTLIYVAVFIYALGERRKKVLFIAPPVLTAVIVLVFGTFIGIRFPRGPEFFAAMSRFFY